LRRVKERLRRAWWLRGLVRERLRFLTFEAARTHRARPYRLTAFDARVFLRHDGTDAFVLHEVVRDPFYTPPEPVRQVLPPPDQTVSILDLGANLGFFGLRMLSLYPKAEITAFEPDAENADILRRCIAANGHDGTWQVVEAAATASDGEMPFTAGEGALSRMPLPSEAATTTVPARDVLPLMASAQLVKIDIEGGEWALIGDERFGNSGPPALLLEWHSYHCPGDNPRRVAREMLERNGYKILHEKPAPVPDEEPFYGAGTLWAWQERS
jgi:FkbM family methyltransferase